MNTAGNPSEILQLVCMQIMHFPSLLSGYFFPVLCVPLLGLHVSFAMNDKAEGKEGQRVVEEEVQAGVEEVQASRMVGMGHGLNG